MCSYNILILGNSKHHRWHVGSSWETWFLFILGVNFIKIWLRHGLVDVFLRNEINQYSLHSQVCETMTFTCKAHLPPAEQASSSLIQMKSSAKFLIQDNYGMWMNEQITPFSEYIVCFCQINAFHIVGVASPKFCGGPKCLTLGEQQYFCLDAASQSTKWLDMLKIWGLWSPGPPGYAYVPPHLLYFGSFLCCIQLQIG